MSAGVIWLVGGLLVCAAEMGVPGVFLLPLGLAACGTGLATEWLGLSMTGQVVVFLVLTGVLVGVAARRMWGRGPQVDAVNAPNAGLIGQTCRVVSFEAGEGRVVLGDGTWLARTGDGSAPPVGALLEVVGLDGTTLVVVVRGGVVRTACGG